MRNDIYNKVKEMRRVKWFLPFYLFALIPLFFSCSDISEDERLIYVKPAEVSRCVLIEDYTGQRCINCPNANDEIHRLQEQYGDDAVISVAIHCGPLAFYTNNRFLGLRTETGDEYYDYWKVEYQPIGQVNRTGLLDYTSWNGKIREELQKTAPVDINVTSQLAGRTLSIETSLMGIEESFVGKLQLWLVEDNITAFQMMPDGSRQDDYLHQHVFRTAVNGTWGEDVSIGEGETVIRSHQDITIPDDWNIDNLSVIAFVYDDKGVQQVRRIKL
ncbi:MAG: Omp28 family outer membrane lipoprotein [Prevotella sp.]|nr:Omp28 family outer membrane lipoprotein [Prevotella sp.]